MFKQVGEINLSTSSTNHIEDSRQWHFFLERQYQRYWNIHFVKKTQELKQTGNYLGRYLKRPRYPHRDCAITAEERWCLSI